MPRKLSTDDCSKVAQPVNTSNGNPGRGPRHGLQRPIKVQTGPVSKIANTISLQPFGLQRYSLRSASQRAGEPNQARKQGDEEEEEDDLDWAAPKKQSKQSIPRERRRSATKEIVEIEDDELDEETVVDPDGDGLMPNDSPEPIQANGKSRPGQGTSTPNSVSAASTRPRRSIQQPSQLVTDTPRTSIRQGNSSAGYTSVILAVRSSPGCQAPETKPAASHEDMLPPQQSGNWQPALNPVAPQGARNQLASSQQSTPHHFTPYRGNKRPAESSPTTSYASGTPSNASRSGVKRQKSSNAIPHRQPQVSREINWDAVLPSGDEFKANLKNASDAIKPVLRKFEELLADIDDEQRKLSAVQSSLFQKKNDYTNDQKKAQDALKDVEESTANENTTLRGLEEVYQQNPGDAELRTFINKRKQNILEHKEVYVIIKSQVDKSIAGIYKSDLEIALVTSRLGQLDDERADVLREKEGVDKAVKRVTIMSKLMEPPWLDSMMDEWLKSEHCKLGDIIGVHNKEV